MGWGFVWLMFILKIPIAMLLGIVWWAIKQTDEPMASDPTGEGGTKQPRHPRPPLPRHPRRGPHGDQALPSPPRTRTVLVRSRETQP